MGYCLRPATEQGELIAEISTGIVVIPALYHQIEIVHFLYILRTSVVESICVFDLMMF